MHYRTKVSPVEKNREDIVLTLAHHPIDRATALNILSDDTVRVEFVKLDKVITTRNSGNDRWIIWLDPAFSPCKKERCIWHEIVHIYLRRMFGGPINDDGLLCNYHDLIEREGKRLAQEKPLSRQELFALVKIEES